MRDRLGSDSRALTGAFMHQAHIAQVFSHLILSQVRRGGEG